MKDWTPEQRHEYDRKAWAVRQGIGEMSEDPQVLAFFDLYLDAKDHYRGLRPQDLTPAAAAAFRAIRQGSGGRLGNPPML